MDADSKMDITIHQAAQTDAPVTATAQYALKDGLAAYKETADVFSADPMEPTAEQWAHDVQALINEFLPNAPDALKLKLVRLKVSGKAEMALTAQRHCSSAQLLQHLIDVFLTWPHLNERLEQLASPSFIAAQPRDTLASVIRGALIELRGNGGA